MKKIIIGIIIGILISSVAYAAVSISSDKVSYKDTTVNAALDNLFDESVNGKTKIAEAITNKGIETLNTDSYDTIVSNINNISTGNPNLRYDEGSGYIQALDENNNWHNIYSTLKLPLSVGYKLSYNLQTEDHSYYPQTSSSITLTYNDIDGTTKTVSSGSGTLDVAIDTKVSYEITIRAVSPSSATIWYNGSKIASSSSNAVGTVKGDFIMDSEKIFNCSAIYNSATGGDYYSNVYHYFDIYYSGTIEAS